MQVLGHRGLSSYHPTISRGAASPAPFAARACRSTGSALVPRGGSVQQQRQHVSNSSRTRVVCQAAKEPPRPRRRRDSSKVQAAVTELPVKAAKVDIPVASQGTLSQSPDATEPEQEKAVNAPEQLVPAVKAAKVPTPIGNQGTFSLSLEQRTAVNAQEQVVRIEAGPGSGKTRVLAARVEWLLQQGVRPESILPIAYTNKAANELEQRLGAEGSRRAGKVVAKTFHSFCLNLLNEFRGHLGTAVKGGRLSIADEDTVTGIVTSMLDLDEMREDDLTELKGMFKHEASPAVRIAKDEEWVQYKQQLIKAVGGTISKMKNFSSSIIRPMSSGTPKVMFGHRVIEQLAAEGVQPFVMWSQQEQDTMGVYWEKYHCQLNGRLDFDDLLHYAAAMLRDNNQIKSIIHQRYQHVLVDEVQDTNLCQFELIKHLLEGPNTTLFVVGDCDQAIYGFRGGNAELFESEFMEKYPNTGIYYLKENYRSGSEITQVADGIRSYERSQDQTFLQTTSMRTGFPGKVEFISVRDKQAQTTFIIDKLQKLAEEGHALDEIAVLARTRYQLETLYYKAVKAAIPVRLHGLFWNAVEVKTIMALLRAVVDPAAAGEQLRVRIIDTASSGHAGFKVPLTKGLGREPIKELEKLLNEQTGPRNTATLGSCLLEGCGCDSLSEEAAHELYERWAKETSRWPRGDSPTADVLEQRMGALQTLAPVWQQQQGLKPLTYGQQAGLARLRGLVQLATAAVIIGEPVDTVMQLLLEESGVLDSLEQAINATNTSTAKGRELQSQLINRRDNLLLLKKLARDKVEEAQADSAQSGDHWQDDESDGRSSAGQKALGSATQLPASMQRLQEFVNYSIMGDNEQQAGDPRISLLTAHSSKGREFKLVIVFDCYDGGIPWERALRNVDSVEKECNLEQERKLLYVAFTRAKDTLIVLWPEVRLAKVDGKWQSVRTEPSRFIKGLL